MNYVKMLGLAALTAATMMAFIGPTSVSADVLCSNETGACTTQGSFGSESEGVVKITTTFKTIECTKSKISAQVTEDVTAKPVRATVTTLDLETSNCNCEMAVLKNGTLSISNIAGSPNGTVTSSGAEITASCSTIFGTVHCIYATNNTHVGGVWGGSTAVLEVNEAELPRQSTSAACSEKAKWEGKYKVNSPDSLFVRAS